jgi:hypothetical protein
MPSEDDPAAGLTAARAGSRVVRDPPDTTLSNSAPSPDVVAFFGCFSSSILPTFMRRRFPRSPARLAGKIGERPWPVIWRAPSRFAPPVMTAARSGREVWQRSERHIAMFAKSPAE